MNVLDLVRPEIRALPAYESVRAPDADARTRAVFLDNNESPWPAPGIEGNVNRYPPQPPRELVRRMAVYYGVGTDAVLPTRGSDDAIDALIRSFCRPAMDSVLITPPTFGMYARFAALNGIPVIEVPLAVDFSFPGDAVSRAADRVRLIFICSPNNPTGGAVANETVETLCANVAGKAVVIVDEAYAEFMNQTSAIALLGKFENLAVLRTLSKGLALAGARVGALLAAPSVIDTVRKVIPPYPLPTPCVAAAEETLSDGSIEIARRRIGMLNAEREIVALALRKVPAVRRVFDSDANFLLVECVDRALVLGKLNAANTRVRAFNDPRLEHCLRIGIGSPAENRQLLAALGAAHA